MSRKTDLQSLVMLSILAGSFYQLYKFRYFARVDIHNLCNDSYSHVVSVINEWPIDHNIKSMNEALAAINSWGSQTNSELDDLKAASLVYVMSMIVNDLLDKLKNNWKRKQVESFKTPIKLLEEFTDPTGSNFPAYDKGNDMMKILYDLIKWEF